MASCEKPLPENSPPNGGIASRHFPGSRLIPAQAPELINDNVTAASEAAQPSGSFLVLILGVLLAQTLALAYPILRSCYIRSFFVENSSLSR
jgi:hypothetical protein